MRPFVLAMAGPSPPEKPDPERPVTRHTAPDGNRPRQVAEWAAVIGPIVAQVLGAVVILYEMLTNVNNAAALGVGLTLALGGKFADVVSQLMKPR